MRSWPHCVSVVYLAIFCWIRIWSKYWNLFIARIMLPVYIKHSFWECIFWNYLLFKIFTKRKFIFYQRYMYSKYVKQRLRVLVDDGDSQWCSRILMCFLFNTWLRSREHRLKQWDYYSLLKTFVNIRLLCNMSERTNQRRT